MITVNEICKNFNGLVLDPVQSEDSEALDLRKETGDDYIVYKIPSYRNNNCFCLGDGGPENVFIDLTGEVKITLVKTDFQESLNALFKAVCINEFQESLSHFETVIDLKAWYSKQENHRFLMNQGTYSATENVWEDKDECWIVNSLPEDLIINFPEPQYVGILPYTEDNGFLDKFGMLVLSENLGFVYLHERK